MSREVDSAEVKDAKWDRIMEIWNESVKDNPNAWHQWRDNHCGFAIWCIDNDIQVDDELDIGPEDNPVIDKDTIKFLRS